MQKNVIQNSISGDPDPRKNDPTRIEPLTHGHDPRRNDPTRISPDTNNPGRTDPTHIPNPLIPSTPSPSPEQPVEPA